jgi:hypothetical protein
MTPYEASGDDTRRLQAISSAKHGAPVVASFALRNRRRSPLFGLSAIG